MRIRVKVAAVAEAVGDHFGEAAEAVGPGRASPRVPVVVRVPGGRGGRHGGEDDGLKMTLD